MLDVRKPGCPADPFEDEAKYPGVKIGARGRTVPVGSLYGYASGIIGLRLFPNPDFDEAAKAKWDAAAYFKGDAKMVRPYRVGMSCGFCHVGPSPVHPPADPANPQWADLSSTVGAQYMWVDVCSSIARNPDNYFYQLVHTYRAGRDGHLAGLHRQHQQSADDERGIQPGRPACAGAALGTRDAGRTDSSTTSSSTTISAVDR